MLILLSWDHYFMKLDKSCFFPYPVALKDAEWSFCFLKNALSAPDAAICQVGFCGNGDGRKNIQLSGQKL